MPRIAHALLLLVFWLLAGGLMLASGMAPLGAMLVLTGATLPVLAIHRVLARREPGREQAGTLGRGLDALRRLQRRDWLWIVLSIAVGIGISAFGVSCRCGVG